MRRLLVGGLLIGCGPADAPDRANPCAGGDALAACSKPTMSADYYAEQSSAYFDTMDTSVELEGWPPYSPQVVRWEWGPWLKLTAFGKEDIEASDTLLTLYPSVVLERDCRGFDTQPFGRCTVTFYYDAHDGRGCPIYEEFTFNDSGEITWIEAWSDQPGLLPGAVDDRWAEGEGVNRLSARIPGLGSAAGAIDLNGEAMRAAAEADVDVADFVWRAEDWTAAWLEELAASDGDRMWEVGCGWE
ncbi:MAG: hypothetical protein ACI8PZ_005705 [Myxococcota bacterium]|jgi:hypothetical protein